MLSRMRNWGHRAGGTVNWLRALYLANCTAALVLVVVYIFGVRIPPVGIRLADSVALAIGYAVLLVAWTLLDWLGVVDRTGFLVEAYQNSGLRPLDIGVALLAVLILWGAWRIDFTALEVYLLAGLALLNSLFSLVQHRSAYSWQAIESIPSVQGDDHQEVAPDEAAQEPSGENPP